jgi:hypothetical protein
LCANLKLPKSRRLKDKRLFLSMGEGRAFIKVDVVIAYLLLF